MPKAAQAIPDALRPFHFHGLRFDGPDGRGECHADCPACGSHKFSVNLERGLYSCYHGGCQFYVEGRGSAGGSTKFLRWLWEASNDATTQYAEFAADRGLLFDDTLMHWGACQSVIGGEWLFPAHNPDGALVQLYKRIRTVDRWELRPTPFAEGDPCHGHAVHGVPLYDPNCDIVYLCEGPGDAMVLWEALRMSKVGDSRLEFTGNPAGSLLAKSSVLAVANCGSVGKPLQRYLDLFRGKRVVLCFDNDQAGRDATRRAAAMLSGVAVEAAYIRWPDGLSDKWDVRDALTTAVTA